VYLYNIFQKKKILSAQFFAIRRKTFFVFIFFEFFRRRWKSRVRCAAQGAWGRIYEKIVGHVTCGVPELRGLKVSAKLGVGLAARQQSATPLRIEQI
jgi:hypothetical protein